MSIEQFVCGGQLTAPSFSSTPDQPTGTAPVNGELPMTIEPAIALAMRDIAKRYGATCALRSADLTLHAGRVHALLGENGAGKSTLVKIIVGAVKPDSGSVSLAGGPVAFRSVAEAIAAGIVPIYQHLSLFPELSVLDNLSAFQLTAGRAGLSRKALVPRDEARAWLARVGLDLDLDHPVSSLSLGERQLLEIARGVGRNCRILVLDEPTAALNGTEADRLFAVVRDLCAQGAAVLFISHKFDEIERLAHEVTVLRDGATVIDAAPIGRHDRAKLVKAMLGMQVEHEHRSGSARTEPVLTAANVRMATGHSLNLSVRAGEIVGLAGLVGSGALAIAATMAGAAPGQGEIAIGEQRFALGDRREAVRLGVAYVPADRHAEGLFPPVSAIGNASASSLNRFSARGLLGRARERGAIEPLLRRLHLHPARPDAEAASFSGGNQQKLLIARCLALPNLRALVLLEPTRGVDVAARAMIHRAVIDMARSGVAVLIASSDLDELTALCDRYLVVRDGMIAEELRGDASTETIMAALVGKAAA
jgi:ABC-type sugar transport system ATPase subunit